MDHPSLRVLYARGADTTALAEALTDDRARIEGDLRAQCVEERADLVVTRRLSPSFDLVPQVVPSSPRFESIGRVLAAVGGGPHSVLAAVTARNLGHRLRVPAEFVCAYSVEEGPDQALATVAELETRVPGIPHRIVEAERASALIDEVADTALLVLGAPGGSFFQRRFFGQGARLIAHAPLGAVVVKEAPRRVFHQMLEPDWVGTLLPASEALVLAHHPVVPVVEAGHVVGIVRTEDLAEAGSTPVGEIASPAVTVRMDDPIRQAARMADVTGGLVPVVDAEDRLVGLWRQH
jgi:CBS domain-containing protein